MTHSRLRTKLGSGTFFAVAGIHDMVAAVVADRLGFDNVTGCSACQ